MTSGAARGRATLRCREPGASGAGGRRPRKATCLRPPRESPRVSATPPASQQNLTFRLQRELLASVSLILKVGCSHEPFHGPSEVKLRSSDCECRWGQFGTFPDPNNHQTTPYARLGQCLLSITLPAHAASQVSQPRAHTISESEPGAHRHWPGSAAGGLRLRKGPGERDGPPWCPGCSALQWLLQSTRWPLFLILQKK